MYRRLVWLTCLIGCIIVISRRPDTIFHPQFWAEDGAVWYADAYNHGFLALLTPHDSYFQTLPRVIAMLAQYIPLWAAPLLFNCAALVIQILPVCFLVSQRSAPIGDFQERLLIAFLYLALPNTSELHGNLTNAQWHLALLSLLIVFGKPPATRLGRLVDLVIIGLSGLTGPFAILIAPAAAILYMKERLHRRNDLLILCLTCALIQGITLLTTKNAIRTERVMGASGVLLAQILTKQVFGAVVLGRRSLARLSLDTPWGLAAAVLTAVLGTAIELYAMAKAPLRWKLFIGFSTTIFAASLAYPMAPSPQWPALQSAGGIRYWFFPMLAFVWIVVWMLRASQPAAIQKVARVLLVIALIGIVQDWGHPRFTDQQFSTHAQIFSQASPGTLVTIPLNPEGWSMQLIKR